MPMFRKKPVIISAEQLTLSHIPKGVYFGGENHAGMFWVQTLEGPLIAQIGDWIITGIQGEIYPCKPDIFAATYEAVTYPHDPLPQPASATLPNGA